MARIKHHPVEALNDASAKAGLGGVAGVNKEHRFGDITVKVYYTIRNETNGSRVESQVGSSVSMQSITLAFRGFASISGTADAGHTKKFAGAQKAAVRTDKGVLDKSGYKKTGKFTVQTSLVDDKGIPISLDKSKFDAYKYWYGKVPEGDREKWGDSETFSYKHSDKSFYTAMKYHPVHFGGGFDFGRFVTFRSPTKKGRDLDLNDYAFLRKQKVGNPTDAKIIAMFSPYAAASGKTYNEAGNSIEKTVPSVSVDITQPAAQLKNKKKADAGDYIYGVLLAVNDVYTATAGDVHEAVMYLSHTTTSVKWYVDDTLLETDSNTNEARLSWSIPNDASGSYVIKAVVIPNMMKAYQASYTVSVSSRTSKTPTLAVPGAPAITRVDAGDGQVNINWTAPSYNGGSAITGYEYRYRENNGGSWGTWMSFGGSITSTSADIAFLTNGTAYAFQVRAVNSVGESAESNTAYATPVAPGTVTLVSSDDIYTATAGTGHEANLTLSAAPSYVFWYVQTPGESDFGDEELIDTSGNLSSSFSYSFPNGASGDYVIRASGTIVSTGEGFDVSYTVSVSLPSSTTTTPTTPTFSPVVSGIAASYSAGNTLTATVNTGAPCYGVYLYINNQYYWFNGGIATTAVPISYTFPDTAQAGSWSITLLVYPWKGNINGDPSYLYPTVTVQ